VYHRFVLALIAIFIFIAYVDTKNLKQYFADNKILKEYHNSSKLIGIGVVENDGKIRVNDVILDTPADRSGVEVGDVVINIDGEKAVSIDMIKNYLSYVKKNQRIALTIQKPDKSVVEIKLIPTSINNFK
jgi:C-terminal processing protease CtpA/Prc